MRIILIILLALILTIFEVSASCENGQIDINGASAEELDELYGIGSAKAEAIINARPFEKVDDLINVIGIGEITLEKIKNQNLACVKNSEEEKKEKKNNSEEIVFEEEIIESEKNNKIIEKELETIVLSPKDIKSEIDKEELNKNKFAVYGLITFCVLLVFLFMIKNERKRKNEFG